MLNAGDTAIVAAADLELLLEALRQRGYTLVGPTERDGAIVLDEIANASALPRGRGDEQEAGRYRLRTRQDGALFGYAAGPQSWKRFVHPPNLVRWRARRSNGGFAAEPETSVPARYAFVGVRGCELAALQVQDRVFLSGPFVDPSYRGRREGAFVLAVNCGSPGGTCFCVSQGTGPGAPAGFDLALTEILDGPHRFALEAGSERGAEVARAVPQRPPTPADREAAAAVVADAARRMGRTLESEGLKDLLYRRYEDPHWDEVARRCLGCANCTLVCPTCFCATVEDHTDLAGAETERRRAWDSCFSQEFSYVHGGSVRTTAGARYRQWITHKLATWHEQFGVSGCVGCGRCITWCPVGIDITAEARAVRQGEAQGVRS